MGLREFAEDVRHGAGTGAIAGALFSATGGMMLEAAPGVGTLAHIGVIALGTTVGAVAGAAAAGISSVTNGHLANDGNEAKSPKGPR